MSNFQMSFQQIENRVRELVPVTKWPDYYNWPTVAGLRAMIFNAETNGFSACFKRVGRRVLVDPVAFHSCVDRLNSNNGGKK